MTRLDEADDCGDEGRGTNSSPQVEEFKMESTLLWYTRAVCTYDVDLALRYLYYINVCQRAILFWRRETGAEGVLKDLGYLWHGDVPKTD